MALVSSHVAPVGVDDPAGPPARRPWWRRIDTTSALIALTWGFVIVPRLTQSLTAPKYRTTVGAPVPLSSPASQIDVVMTYGLVLLCLVIVVRRSGALPVARRGLVLVLLAPWVYLVCRNLYIDARPDRGALVYPMVVLALWVLRPRMEQLAVLGYLVGVTALISLALGVLLPSKGIYTSVTGELIAPEKQILPGGVLIGTFTDSNNLGQFLVLGLPAVLLIPRLRWRVVMLLACTYAIVWTSSRSSILGVVLSGLLALTLTVLPRAGRRLVALAAVGCAAAAVVLIPLTTDSDTAFTNRGLIWRQSLAAWGDSPVVGLGSTWYSELAKYANPLGGLAFHGHNLFVHTMVTGGLVNLALLAALGVSAWVMAGRWAADGVAFPAVYLVALLVSCSLEVSFGFVDREFLAAVAILPVACICLAARDRSPGEDDAQHG